LANTKGKKAKRKEREKIIEEARRLAQLQKIRELEMAGVENIPTAKEIKRLRQKQDIDYTKEIPFKREVPNFVYHTEES
jgi:pre-mRNA-splicing factor CDC5/CEF1